MKQILEYVTDFELSVEFNSKDHSRIFFMETTTWNNLLIVHPSDVNELPIGVEVYRIHARSMVRRAKYDYERPWGWQPNKYEEVHLCFYHTNLEQLLKYSLEWFESHYDAKTGPVKTQHRTDRLVKTIKDVTINRIEHYTNMEAFKDEA